MLTCDTYLTPTSLDEALRLWADAGAEGGRLVAGATDTLPWARQGRAGDIAGDKHVSVVVDISRVAELHGYQLQNGRVRLGANVVMQRFLEDAALKAHLPCMPYCAVWFADDQIRQQATLAGNIVNASPAADGTPPMLALNARVELAKAGRTGAERRSMPLTEFVLGPGRTAREPGEIVTAIDCESAQGYGGAFEKVGSRRSLVISTVCVAACVKPSADGGRFEDVRLAMAGIGPVPVRLTDVEDFLRGKPVAAETIAAAAEMPTDRIASRTRQDYRKGVVRGFIERALRDALADAGAGLPENPLPRELAHA